MFVFAWKKSDIPGEEHENKVTKILVSIGFSIGAMVFTTFLARRVGLLDKNVKILWASVREPYNYIQAKQLGCHLITVPPKIIEKIEKFGKSFDKLTKDTVKGFLEDSKKSKFNI